MNPIDDLHEYITNEIKRLEVRIGRLENRINDLETELSIVKDRADHAYNKATS